MEGALRLGLDSSKNILKESVLQLSPCLPVLLCILHAFSLTIFSAFPCFLLLSWVRLSFPDVSVYISRESGMILKGRCPYSHF